MAQLLLGSGRVPIGAVLTATLAALSRSKSRSPDPGLTTELALFVTYLTGVLCVVYRSVGTACGTALALLPEGIAVPADEVPQGVEPAANSAWPRNSWASFSVLLARRSSLFSRSSSWPHWS